MGNPNEPYNNEGIAPAFISIIIFTLIIPGLIILSIDNGFVKFAEMRGVTSDCWENSRHEVVCYNPDPDEGQKKANCKFWPVFLWDSSLKK